MRCQKYWFSVFLIVAFSVFLLADIKNSSNDRTEISPAVNVYKPGYLLQDTNGDDIIDCVNTKIILPKSPSEAEIASAANMGARLGYETTALDFDILEIGLDKKKPYEIPVIIISQEQDFLQKTGVNVMEMNTRLKPGQGEIIFIAPTDIFKKGGAAITGYDDSGLLAAAAYLSGRYPLIWGIDDETIENLAEKVIEFFQQQKISIDFIQPQTIIIENNSPGIKKIILQVIIPDINAFEAAVHAVEREDSEDLKTNEHIPEKKIIDKIKPNDLIFTGIDNIEMLIQCREKSRTIHLRPEKPWQIEIPDDYAASAPEEMSLSQLFTIKGLLKDTNQDFIPDTVNAYVSVGGEECPEGLVNLALRTGLETAGMRFPFVMIGGENLSEEKSGMPILFGKDHYQIRQLKAKNKLLILSKSEKTGYIQFIPEAFGKTGSLVLTGTDKEGMLAVTDYLTKRFPFLWDYGKGNYRLEDVETEVRRFFQVKSPAGLAAASLYKLKKWLSRIENKTIDKLDIELDLKEIPAGLDDLVTEIVQEKFPEGDLNIKLNQTGYGLGKVVFSEDLEIPWEVDEFWSIFDQSILPNLKPDSSGEIIVRVSESPEVRQKLRQEIENRLKTKGISLESIEMTVLCAYKQGYSWLYDSILPKIKHKKVGSITIKYHNLRDSDEIRWQTVHANTRWLQEIFPIDTILARELKIPESVITFTPTREKDPIYAVEVLDNKGDLILQDSFNPKYVVRPFFDLFPEYENVRVTTGWVFADIDGKILVDQRIKTDAEIFWDHLQKNIYRKILDYIMDIQEGNPLPENAPYFDEFRVELSLSEPNYRLGIDEEVISSTEALHEDILFHTLAFFNRIGGRYDIGNLHYPGRILPHIHSIPSGGPGKVKLVFTGKEKARPGVSLTYTEKGCEPYKLRFFIPQLEIKPPPLRGIQVEYQSDKLDHLWFDVTATDKQDRYEDFKLRGSEEEIARSFISVEKYAAMLDLLAGMHSKGIFSDSLNYDRINKLVFRFLLEDDKSFSNIKEFCRSTDPKTTINPVVWDHDFEYRGDRLVQWNTPIPPQEAEIILSRLNTFPEINVYYMTRSFLGHNIFALDIYSPFGSGFISQAKMNALKPALLLQGRVHGNEVSSTSHILRLAELCATDNAYKSYLKNVNLVLYPITNPDGAQLAYEMYLDNPDYMLHAGRYGALGTDVRSTASNEDNIYPETGMPLKLRETWLPDIVIDMHGIPSHEWVQYFAGYSAWVNSRKGGARSYWLPRGWYITGFNWIEDDKHPDIMKAQKAITDAVVRSITVVPAVEAMNKRIYDRYIKYGQQDRDTYREYFYKGIQLEARLKSKKITEEEKKSSTGLAVTYYSIVTEAADETVNGDWLGLVCKAGLAHSTALLQYLSEGKNKIIQENKEYKDMIIRRKYRKKPVIPIEKTKEEKQ